MTLVAAPAAADKFPWQEFENNITTASEVQSLGTDIFGDQVSLQDGALSFSATDVSIPGNNALPVAFERSYRLFNREYYISDEMLADWELELPRISGTYAPNWVGRGGAITDRCSFGGAPPDIQSPVDAMPSETVMSYWQGLQIQIPGVDSGDLLLAPSEAPGPPGGPYPWITNGQTRLSCLTGANGVGNEPGSGQGFLAIAADGTKYWFDWMAQYYVPDSSQISQANTPGGKPITWTFPRRKNVLYATRVEDRFGNWVTYSYSNSWNQPGRLTEINSSDGRKITVSYSSGFVSSVTATSNDGPARVWTYAYGSTSSGRTTLTSVTLPDSTQWQIGFAQFTNAEIQYLDIFPPGEPIRSCYFLETPQNWAVAPIGTITHPSGATGTFSARIIEHGRSNVTLSCSNVWMTPGQEGILGNDPNDDVNLFTISYHAFSLVSKTISGAGVPTATWGYSYFPGISIYMHPGTTYDNPICIGAHCYQPPTCSGGPCEGSSQTWVSGPDGQWARYTFGNSFLYNEGKLLKVETGSGPSNILQEVTNTYDFARSGRSYPSRFGNSVRFYPDVTTVENLRPQTGSITSRQGITFSWQVPTDCGSPVGPCFDSFVRPTHVVRSSTLPGNPSRRERTEYEDNTGKWVLGQERRVTCVAPTTAPPGGCGASGAVVSETTYDPTWALPLVSKSFGKTVRTLAWNTTASIASGQRGTVASVRDGNDNAITASSWKRGIPRTIQYPATPEAPSGSTRTASVNDHGWITSVTDENGFTTGYGYDVMGRVQLVEYPGGDTVAWTNTTSGFSRSGSPKYGLPTGHWQQVVSTGANRKITYFDALWRPVVVESFDNTNGTTANATRSVTVQRYDAAGRQAFLSYPMSGLVDYAASGLDGTHTTYDALDRVTKVEQAWEGPGVLSTTTEYLSGFRTRVTPPRGQGAGSAFQTTTSYLAWDQPTTDFPAAIAHPEGANTDIARDVFGKPTALVRRNNSGSTSLTRSYVYDSHQQLCKAAEPETGATLMGYDAAGNLTWSAAGLPMGIACHATGNHATINPRKAVRTYDARNRLRTLGFPDGRGNQAWTYTRDGLPDTITTNNSTGGDVVTNSYSYNRRRLLVGETFGVGSQLWALGYAYNALGHLSSHTTPGLVVDFAPNALGQPTRAGTYATAVGYFPNGAVKQFTYGNGVKRTLTQNVRGLPDTGCDFSGSSCTASAVLRDSYDYDGHGNVLAITDGRTGSRGNRDMSYDALDRLTSTVSPMFGTATYGYDVLDNLHTVQVTGGTKTRNHTYLYDASNRLTNVTNTVGGSTVIGLAYDAQGNLANKNGAVHAFDFGNRLREVTGVEQYRYDGHGRRALAIRNGQNLYSLYGHDGTLRFQRDERTGKTIDYVHLGGSLVAQVENAIPLSTPTLTAPGYSASGDFTVSWSGVALASRYQLQQRLNGDSWSQIHDAAGSSLSITGRTPGSWGYRVRACHATSCGNWSSVATVTVEAPPAAAPTLTAPGTSTTGSYTVSWTTVPAAATYQLQENVNSGSWSTIHDASSTSRALSGKTNGAWSYRVRACNPAGCSGYSTVRVTQVTLPPSSVPVLTVPSSSVTGNYTISWSSVATATRYELQERLGTGSWSLVHDAAATSKAISGKASGSWGYRARACNADVCGSWSSASAVQVTLPPATAPTLTVPGTNSSGSYTVSWNSVSAATRYELQERLGSGSWSLVHDAAATSKAISGKTSGSWGYRVRACNVGGCSAYSSIASVAVTLPPTGVPTLSGPSTGMNGSYTISWTSVSVATRYELQERLGSGSWAQIHNAAATSRAISGKANGSWSYRVRACNTGGCAGWSSTHAVQVLNKPASAPTLTVPATNTTGGYTIGWNSVATSTRYELEERLGSGSWVQIHNAAGTSRAVSGKTTGSWNYRVRACNDAGCSGWSSTATVAVTRPPTSAPTLTAPATNTTGSYTVSWTTVTHATSYQLQERLGTGSWTQIHNAAGTSRAISGKGNGDWGYRARACNVAGCGGWSSTRTVAVTTTPPATPVLTLTGTGPGSFTASWPAVPFASSYQLQRQLDTGVWVHDWEGSATSRQYARPHGIYRYQLRACNAVGCSAWTPTQTIVLSPPGGGQCPLPPCDIEP